LTANQNPGPDPRREAALLRALGRLARGLSALFWGLPATLIVSAETARADWLKPLGLLPGLATNGLLLYGLWQMGGFQKTERPWIRALDRAKFTGLINFGLCPFVYWHNKMPNLLFFTTMVVVFQFTALLFLYHLNQVIERLGAMLPDETLRQETRQFTALNRSLVVTLLLLALAYLGLQLVPQPGANITLALAWIEHGGFWLLIFFALLPLAMTMALLWKTKEVILDSVFGPRH
jgi:hypothetical protein